jgi:hypothetical protein
LDASSRTIGSGARPVDPRADLAQARGYLFSAIDAGTRVN